VNELKQSHETVESKRGNDEAEKEKRWER